MENGIVIHHLYVYDPSNANSVAEAVRLNNKTVISRNTTFFTYVVMEKGIRDLVINRFITTTAP